MALRACACTAIMGLFSDLYLELVPALPKTRDGMYAHPLHLKVIYIDAPAPRSAAYHKMMAVPITAYHFMFLRSRNRLGEPMASPDAAVRILLISKAWPASPTVSITMAASPSVQSMRDGCRIRDI